MVEETKNARKLANYISSTNLRIVKKNSYDYNNMGALLTDIVLQAGLSYENVVLPRVSFILNVLNKKNTLKDYVAFIEIHGIEYALQCKNKRKINLMKDLLVFLSNHNINKCTDFKNFIKDLRNHQELIAIKGIGPKTINYTQKLLGLDTIAVDRHIITYCKNAGINESNYFNIKKIVEYAADFLNIPRSVMDDSIWYFMSTQ